MAFIIYGRANMKIGFGEEMTRCPYCESDSTADVFVYGTYFHIFWLPMFPVNKDVNLTCHRCGGKRVGLIFNKNLFKYPNHLNHSYRYKWYSYIGLALVLSPFAMVLAGILIESFSSAT